MNRGFGVFPGISAGLANTEHSMKRKFFVILFWILGKLCWPGMRSEGWIRGGHGRTNAVVQRCPAVETASQGFRCVNQFIHLRIGLPTNLERLLIPQVAG